MSPNYETVLIETPSQAWEDEDAFRNLSDFKRSNAPEHAFGFHASRSGEHIFIDWINEFADEIDQSLDPKQFNKQRVLKLFRSGRKLYFADVASELDIELREAVELCQELISEGEIYAHKD